MLLIILKLYLEKQELMPGQFILVKAKLFCNSPEARLNLRARSRRETRLGETEHLIDAEWSSMLGSISNRVGSDGKSYLLPACPDSYRQRGHPGLKSQLNSPCPAPRCHWTSALELFWPHLSHHGCSWDDAQAMCTPVNYTGASQGPEYDLYS